MGEQRITNALLASLDEYLLSSGDGYPYTENRAINH
jgi:hypothetical protein